MFGDNSLDGSQMHWWGLTWCASCRPICRR